MSMIQFESGQFILGNLYGESTAEEANAMAMAAYEVANVDPDVDERKFDDFKYDVIEARLIEDIEGAIDNAVNDFWSRVRNGEFTVMVKEEA